MNGGLRAYPECYTSDMFQRLSGSVSRIMLTAMLITFLSPGFGWHVNATHHEIEHGAVAAHQHDHDSDAAHHEDDAHGVIGHLLGHLPAFLSSSPAIPRVAPVAAAFTDVTVQWPRVSTEPPLRPPRFS